MDAALLVVFIVAGLAVAAVAARIVWEGHNNVGGRSSSDAPGGWFGGE